MAAVARKIRYRANSAIKIQKQVRMHLALCKHRPRYQSIRALRALQDRVQTLTALGELVTEMVICILAYDSVTNLSLSLLSQYIYYTPLSFLLYVANSHF